QLRPGVWCTGR
ncbi:arginine rich protein, partial [Mycobacterium tuberculosis]